jgi:hypothetical protein
MPVRRLNHSVAVIALTLAGCTAMTPAASSNAVLTPERSWVIVNKPPQAAAVDVVRAFHDRGFVLVDIQRDDRGVVARFKGARKAVSERVIGALDVVMATAEIAEAFTDDREGDPHHEHEPTIEHYEIGSVFYVRLEPRGEMTSIAAFGRPTNNGVEACTADPDVVAPCAKLEAGPTVYPEIAGFAEAEVIHGVFSELRLIGLVVAPDLEVAVASRRCWERRRDIERRAARVSHPRARAGIMRTAPTCDVGEPLARK